MQKVEFWARNTQIAKTLSFFDEFPRFVHASRPVLLGSNNDWEILIQGDTTTSCIREALANLDEPFNPNLNLQKFLWGKKRDQPKKALPLVYEELRRGFEKICLLEHTGDCDDQIIRAHSLQKSLFKFHAKQGHVYHFEPFTGDRDKDKNLLPNLVGINNATTFAGFCGRHDSEIFSPIENAPFRQTSEQTFLYHYRAFAQMYYDKAHKFKVIKKTFQELLKKFDPAELIALARSVKRNEYDVSELKKRKLRLDNNLKNKNWSCVESYVFIGDEMPGMLTTNFFAPRKNFHGRIFQDTKSLLPLNWVSFTVTASNDRALFLLCGDEGCETLRQFVISFREMPNQTLAMLTYVFCTFENFILLPKWWESLSQISQQKFINAFQGRFYRRELPNTCDWQLKEVSL